MANDRIQVVLKTEFDRLFGPDVQFLIKAGEVAEGEALSNERAGQIVMSLYLNEPYNAHQKYRLFGPDYERVFGRANHASADIPGTLDVWRRESRGGED